MTPLEKSLGKKKVVSGKVGDSEVMKVLPNPGSIVIKSAEFIKSSVTVESCPKEQFPEFAVIGRSNVGKSSLINLLTKRKRLALISKTPGKTQCINHFLIDNRWYLVDLPGYGFSRVEDEKKVTWNQFTRDYFLQRGTLANVLLLVDASIPPLPLDLSCADWLGEAQVPFTIVFTKVDKRKGGGGAGIHEANIERFKEALSQTWASLPPCFATSARLGSGREELLRYISQLRQHFKVSDRRVFGLGGHFSEHQLRQLRSRDRV